MQQPSRRFFIYYTVQTVFYQTDTALRIQQPGAVLK